MAKKKKSKKQSRNTNMPSTSLIDLPNEISHQIFSYIVPSNRVYRLKSCVQQTPFLELVKKELGDDYMSSRFHRERRPVPYSYEPAFDPRHVAKPIISLLLIHPTLTVSVLQLVSAQNEFSFPNVATLQLFADRSKAGYRLYVNSISIDACGRAVMRKSAKRPKYCEYAFEHEPDGEIVDVIKSFPNLRRLRLRLGGIGPGTILKSLHEQHYSRLDARFDDTVWAVDDIELIRKIIGATVPGHFSAHDDSDNVKSDYALQLPTDMLVERTASPRSFLGPLEGATVYCPVPRNRWRWFRDIVPENSYSKILGIQICFEGALAEDSYSQILGSCMYHHSAADDWEIVDKVLDKVITSREHHAQNQEACRVLRLRRKFGKRYPGEGGSPSSDEWGMYLAWDHQRADEELKGRGESVRW